MLFDQPFKVLFLLVALTVTPTFAAFGLSESGNSWTVDTNAGLVFTGELYDTATMVSQRDVHIDVMFLVDKTNADITSLKFNGIEAQDSSKRSHIVRRTFPVFFSVFAHAR